MRTLVLNALVGGILLSPVATTSSIVTETHNGYTPEHVPGVDVFKEIRCANASTGEYRWAYPPKPSSRTGIQNATTYPLECSQTTGPEEGFVSGDESCLFLNIYTTANFTSTSNYPVYFWIYRGRYSRGSATALTYVGSGLASQGIFVVTINYRLGGLGFPTHPKLTAEAGIPSGNWGIYDLILALHWTNENIQNFEGNPRQITIGGKNAVLAKGITYLSKRNVGTIAEVRNLSVETILSTGATQDTIFAGTESDGNQAYKESRLYRPVIDGYVLPHTWNEGKRF